MSSVGSYSDNSDYNGSEGSGNYNSGKDNETNKENTTLKDSGPNVSNTNNRNINSELSPLDFVIEKQECTSIYNIDISISNIED